MAAVIPDLTRQEWLAVLCHPAAAWIAALSVCGLVWLVFRALYWRVWR